MMRKLEMYEIGPDDISEENITLEWESREADKPPLCPRDGHAMSKQQQRYTLIDRFVVTYEAWVCSECGQEFLNSEQARHFGTLQRLNLLLQKKVNSPKSQVLFDGQDLFVNLSLMQGMINRQQHAIAA